MEDHIKRALESRRKHATPGQFHMPQEIAEHQAAALAANQEAAARRVEQWQQVQVDPQRYLDEVRRAHERLVAAREAHAPEAAGGHEHITPGTQCMVCVGILQVGSALSSDSVTDTAAVHARLDEVEAANQALGV